VVPARGSAGLVHSLVLTSAGSVIAFGDNSSTQCRVPPTLTNVVAVSAGGRHSLALTAAGVVVAWGDNTFGQLAAPVGPPTIAGIDAGYEHSVAFNNCPADLNGDAVVNSGDIAIILSGWATGAGDLDCDGVVTSNDLAILLGSWGTCP
ncbi:MAG: hypothetical protein ACKO3W_02235, partial [bacterium]